MTNQKVINKENQEKYNNLLASINWDNWHDEEKNRYFDLTEVLFNRLEWLKEFINLDEDSDDSEHNDTIEMLQQLLELLDEKKIKSIL